ncbi:MAG TPA: glycosyltransferase family 39 protein [Solirubrobacteraceae bacterium]|jgi:4-amino-4-deoxy-L-arabinose transferase-like glycosyltransferase|nr:glycosyltransferase family 39 protein [Solirubrobacteraceae bacterium]
MPAWLAAPGERRRVTITLAAVLVIAGLAFAWGANGQALEIYYAAAVRSMAASWHDFLFGAFDPAGTITLDKLPGAFWLQALSVRIFGLHTWTIVLPQILEGIATVLALYVVVRRQAGTLAGLVAAALAAVSPALVALDRGNVADSLLIMLLVLAADATTRAATTGRLRTLLLAGALVGLAFQAKMIEAWAILPALAVFYILSAPGTMRRRVAAVAAAGLVVAVVSLSWMTFVSLVPAGSRPDVDGTTHNSIYQQVFQYNGFGRIDAPVASAGAGPTAAALLSLFSVRHGPGADRLVVGAAGRDGAWLLPAALLSVVGVLLARRRRDRRDPVRSGAVMWAVWLATLFVLFSAAGAINPYYLGALSPPIAALCGIGVSVAWRRRGQGRAALGWLLTAAIATAVYALALLPARDRPGWLPAGVVVLGAAAALMALWALLAPAPRRAALAVGAVLIAAALAPVVASASLVCGGRGPFDTPFQTPAVTAVTQGLARRAQDLSPQVVATFKRGGQGTRYPLATYTSLVAAPLIYATGDEVLPIGGFRGTNPSPSLASLRHLIASGQLHIVLGPAGTDPRMRWVGAHCAHLRPVGLIPAFYCGVPPGFP